LSIVMGKSRTRRPVAWKMAFATAAAGNIYGAQPHRFNSGGHDPACSVTTQELRAGDDA